MAASPAKFFFGFLIVSISLWMVFILCSRLFAWILSRVLGASVGFRVGGWKCLRDVVVKFKKGAIESVSAGEIKLSLRQSLVKLGVGFLSRDPKVQVLICDLEVVMRSSNSSGSSQKAKSRKSRTSGRGKWMVVANIARFLSVFVTDLVVKAPKAMIEVKELKLDISKDGGTKPNLYVKLHLLPILVHLCESRIISDPSSNLSNGRCSAQASSGVIDRTSAAFFCEEFSLSSEFGHDREAGIITRNIQIISADAILNLDEDSFSKSKRSSASVHSEEFRTSTAAAPPVNKPHKQQQLLVALAKYSPSFPEKVSFSLPKLDVRYVNREHGLLIENNITGIELKSVKSRSFEDTGESTRLDVQMEFSEIHLFRESGSSILEIMKVDVVSFIYIPIQPISPVRAEVDVKLGGTQCNLFITRLEPWLRLHFSRKKKLVLQEGTSTLEKSKSADMKAIMWTGTVSAPEMAVAVYGIDNLAVYHCCSQSSHVFANNISNMGTAIHVELGELNLHLADEYQECFKETLFGIEPNSGSLMHIAKVSLDWGRRDKTSPDEVGCRSNLVLSVDITGMGIHFSFKRVESLIINAMAFKALLKSLSIAGRKTVKDGGVHISKTSGKGTRLVKLNLERCSIKFCDDTGLDNTVIGDPKSVNYGSQGGRVVFSSLADGTPRTASIMSIASEECKRLKYSVSLEILHFSFCLNKEKQSTQMELERARSIYQEYLEEHKPCSKVTLFDMQNAKLVRRTGGLKEIAVCSLFSATDITLRWEPDVHLSLYELILRLRCLVHTQKLEEHENEHIKDISGVRDGEPREGLSQSSSVNKNKKKESMFAIDVETLTISAEVGDGVEAELQVQSIFSENAYIGVLLEGLMLGFNGSRVFKSTRMQISRIPTASSNLSNAVPILSSGRWDWVVQGLDVHICMPYRLQLRAIDDSVEEMLRGLKLITAAKNKLISPLKKESSKTKKSSTKFGRIRFCIRRLTADIEEEPIQGWLDEHNQLMKREACELAVRLNFLEELICKAEQSHKGAETNDPSNGKKMFFDGTEIDVEDPLAIEKLKEQIYKRSFQSYYQACQSLIPSEGSGACREGFQAGFKPSAARTSLFSVCATDFDLSLTRIDGGDAGMVEVLKKLDPICRENNIPFSRLYGSNVDLNTGSLVVQLRNYTFPLLSATSGKCEGRIVLAQQATCFQPQILQDVFIGRWRKVRIFRSASGTTPPMKTYSDLRIFFQQGEISFGVGYEPAFADISYAFAVALRRANLSHRNPGVPQTTKKERSLPWWDDMRNYIHGNITLFFSESKWTVLATTDPYESHDKLQIVSGPMELQQSDGRVFVSAKDFKIILSSLESLISRHSLKAPAVTSGIAFIEAPVFNLEVTMDWECESGNSLNHYLYAFPNEGKPREKVFDPFRSTSLSLRWNFSLRPEKFHQSSSGAVDASEGLTAYGPEEKPENISFASPTMNLGAHDLAWIMKFWGMNYYPPHKLRSFSRWPRFGVPRVARSGNLSLDKVMTEFMLRVDATPSLVKYMPLDSEDPAKGLTFNMTKLKYELCYSRGKQKYTFECKRDALDLVYQGLDLHMPKVFINKNECPHVATTIQFLRKSSHGALMDRVPSGKGNPKRDEKHRDEGFLLSSDYFTIRRQAPKADPERLLAWQEAGRRNLEMTYVRSEFENGSESDEHTRSDPSDDDGYNVVIADNCQRVFVYGLKLLWTIENRNAVWSFVGGISKAFEPPKPSPSRQYTQRKILGETQKESGSGMHQGKTSRPSASHGENSSSQHNQTAGPISSPSHSIKMEKSSEGVGKSEISDGEEEGTRHFMVNVIEPQFNLHSEEANGRFLLAAVSGRVLARSFHSVLRVGVEVIEQALGTGSVQIPESTPEMTWTRMEFSVMLEHVQAHVAPTDVDPGAGLQWLPKIRRNSPKVKRTGALLERVFMPCDMYFRYTRHKGGTPDLKVKPLKELTFNSHNITASMTSRQFQVMLDVLTNLLFARLPKPRKSSLEYPTEDDEDVGEEADEVVPDGVEEVELAKINLEEKERERKLLLDDTRKLSHSSDTSEGPQMDREGNLWMVSGGRSMLVQELKKELLNAQKSRKAASASLRKALRKAAQLRLMEKEKNKSPSYAMCISLQINKVVWSMLVDGRSFAEAEINDMIYDFDRDYKDIGVARFTTKYFVVRNCLLHAKSDMLLSAWNPPPEWGKKVMLRVDAKQGAPKDGHYPLEQFHVEIYPLRIHLTETMYRMMWEYFFPEEEQDSQRRQEVWKISTTAGSKRVKKGSSSHESSGPASHSMKEVELASRMSSAVVSTSVTAQPQTNADNAQTSNTINLRSSTGGSAQELRRTSSFDRTWEETVAESVANELVLQAHSSTVASSAEQQEESSKQKLKDPKSVKSGRPSHEEKKGGKSQEEKKSRPRKMMEFHDIKISQVELLVTYEGSRFVVNDLKLLMDTFHRVEFTGTWRRLFSRVKKHIIWGVLKSVTGMQGKKFKDKSQNQRESTDNDLNLSDNDQAGKHDQHPVTWFKRQSDGAGDGFVTSIRGLFNTQRRKAKAFVLRTMRGEAENDFHGEWSDSDVEFSPFARQLTITKAKRLIRRHTKKFRPRGQRGSSSQQRESLPSSPRETTAFESGSSSGSSPYEDFHE